VLLPRTVVPPRDSARRDSRPGRLTGCGPGGQQRGQSLSGQKVYVLSKTPDGVLTEREEFACGVRLNQAVQWRCRQLAARHTRMKRASCAVHGACGLQMPNSSNFAIKSRTFGLRAGCLSGCLARDDIAHAGFPAAACLAALLRVDRMCASDLCSGKTQIHDANEQVCMRALSRPRTRRSRCARRCPAPARLRAERFEIAAGRRG
jgi:hypothetical protein